MPRYDYGCADGHVTESVEAIDREKIACPACGRMARRAAVYREQFIRGETVATGRTPRKHEALDDKGRFNLTRVVEAQHQMVDEGSMPEIKPLLNRGRRLHKAGVKSAVARTE